MRVLAEHNLSLMDAKPMLPCDQWSGGGSGREKGAQATRGHREGTTWNQIMTISINSKYIMKEIQATRGHRLEINHDDISAKKHIRKQRAPRGDHLESNQDDI